MRLLQLTITNFGVFQGENAFNLAPTHGSIVLFGGKNGSGKTTILDSIRLCLYGARAVSEKPSKREYDEYILKKIHQRKNMLVPNVTASVSLQLEYIQFGHREEYEVTRAWTTRNSAITERLTVRRNGIELDELAEERWQDFIDELIPFGVSSLFFFDGEKIQSLASDSLSEQILGNEVKRLFGLNIIERLQADLDIYVYRQKKGQTFNDLIVGVDQAREARDTVEEEYISARQDRSHTENLLLHLRNKIEELEKKISRESGGFGSHRDQLKTELARIDNVIAQTEKSIHDLYTGLLPFALVPELSRALQEQLTAELEYERWTAAQKVVLPRIDMIRDKLASDEFYRKALPTISKQARNKTIGQLLDMLDTIVEVPDNIANVQVRHQLSESERYQMMSWIHQASHELPEQLKKLTEQFERAESKRQALQAQLRKVPDDELIKPMMDELNKLYQKLGELEAIAAQEESKLAHLLNRRQEAQRQLHKAYEALREAEQLESRLKMLSKVHQVLDKFLERLTTEKVDQLQNLIAARFSELIRKPDLVHRVLIDPKGFRITLFDKDGREIHKDGLSAGEKQMFAIAVLWALRQLSGRPFPVVVDTPLARLDSEHRDHLIQNYFPRISHQVILFSTDTEVDQNYFKLLEPYISHAYHLVYDSKTGATQIHEGYFWGEVTHAT